MAKKILKKKTRQVIKTTIAEKTKECLFNLIHEQLERLETVMTSSAAENIQPDDMAFIIGLLRPVALFVEYRAYGKNEKKTPRPKARRKG